MNISEYIHHLEEIERAFEEAPLGTFTDQTKQHVKDVISGAVKDVAKGKSSGPHHQDSGEAKIRESTAGVSRKPSSDCKACGCSSKHLCGLTAWNT